ncbi:MAG: hypothetical protein WBN57_06780 [Gammaproteobacteria bacterium]|jgi:hypothetical protein
MTSAEELHLDEEGIPILTDIVRDDDVPEPPDLRLANRVSAMAPREIADELLGNDSFRKHLEEVAASLTHSVCQQMEQALQPVLEQAISTALNEKDVVSHEAIHQQLESTLPDLVAEALQASGEHTD